MSLANRVNRKALFCVPDPECRAFKRIRKHGNIEQWWTEQFGFGFECLTSRKQDTLSRLRQAKESGKVSKNILTDNNLKHSRLILFVKSALTQRGVARMLSSMELEELRSTKSPQSGLC